MNLQVVKKKDEDMTEKTCVVDGCDKPRKVTERGGVMTRCEEHQREYWNEHAAKKREKAAYAPPAAPKPEMKVRVRASGIVGSEPVEEAPAIQPPAQSDDCDDCPECVYRDVIDLLAQRDPDVRALVDLRRNEIALLAKMGFVKRRKGSQP